MLCVSIVQSVLNLLWYSPTKATTNADIRHITIIISTMCDILFSKKQFDFWRCLKAVETIGNYSNNYSHKTLLGNE